MLSFNPLVFPELDDAAAAQQAALIAFQGDDLVGKDGPMVRIGFDLTFLYEEYQVHQERHPGTAFITSSTLPLMVSGDTVRVDLAGVGNVAAFKDQLAAVGMTDIVSFGTLVSGTLPISALDDLAALNSLRLARPAYQPITHVGAVTSQGDEAMRADLARAGFGVDGTGVTVGVLSDSFNALGGMAGDIASDDLPQDTQILEDSSGTDEGRGMAQLIHDLAPGAAIQFATANGGEANFAQNILDLANAGSNVIVDDVSYFAEPFFQDGVVAQAANAVYAQGIPFFSSAGNQADQSYESPFVDSGVTTTNGGKLHDFDPGSGVSTLQQITLPVGASITASFQWDEPFGSLGGPGSTSDLDIAIVGVDQMTVIGTTMTNNVGGDPLEIFQVINDGSVDIDNDGQPDTTFYVRIELVSGPAPGLLKYLDYDGEATVEMFGTNSSTDVGHHNTSGALGIAASAYFLTPAFGVSPPQLNDFSSKGGTLLFFDTSGNRLDTPLNPNSPQVTGVDGANTTFFGNDIPIDSDSFPNFFGTSAAAPHVAAVAALMIDLAGGPDTITPQSIYDAFMETAIDIVDRFQFSDQSTIPIPNGQGFDVFSGFGLVDAVAALQKVVTISIGDDVTVVEGDSGTVDAVFVVALTAPVPQTVTVTYTTVDVTAIAPEDYEAQSGTLTFLPGESLSQSITIAVVGDEVVESAETFLVRITSVVGVFLDRDEAVGTILNDDLDFLVNDVSVVEGHTGSRNVVFTVSTFGEIPDTATVRYTTLDDSATAGADYLPVSGQLAFPPGGPTTALITVPVLGDRVNEGDHTFFLYLYSAVNGHLPDPLGTATIIEDDPLPSLYVNDVQLTSTAAGNLQAVFSVALDTASGRTVTVQFATADGAAANGVDYQGQAGSLAFSPGVTTMQVTVPVMTTAVYSSNKKFYLNLSQAQGALLADPQGACTMVYATGPVGEYIIDDGDQGYSRTPVGWSNLTNTLAYNLDYDYAAAGSGSVTATWSFTAIPNGAYEVFTRWSAFSNRATNAPYTILTGATSLGTVTVNQQVAPAGDQSNGVIWQSLGMFTAASNKLSVRLANNANGIVVADAVRIVADGIAPQVPEMDVAAFDRSISTGDVSPSAIDGTDFGEATASSGAVRIFTIANHGNADLHLTGSPAVVISGANASDFTVTTQPATTVGPGKTTTFQVMFRPGAVGLRSATVSIANDDDSENPYTFSVQGTGSGPPQSLFVIDDSTAGFSNTGDWTTVSDAQAYQGQLHSIAASQGSDKAVWHFTGLAPGGYEVYATWVAGGNRATNAPFTVSNLTDNSYTVFVNQQQAPLITINSASWGSLGIVEVTGGALEVTLSNVANGAVVADAVMVIRHGSTPPPTPPPAAEHNVAWPEDVNGDNRVSPSDALAVVNRLLSLTTSPAAAPLAATAAATTAATTKTYYVDVNGDGKVTPSDLLMVVNYLLSSPASAPSAAPQTASAPPLLAAAAVDSAIALAAGADDADASQPLPFFEPAGGGTEGAASASAPAPQLMTAVVAASLTDDEGDDEAPLSGDLELAFLDA